MTIIADHPGPGFDRTDPVIIQIFTQRGHSDNVEQGLYAPIAERLSGVGVSGEDVFSGRFENGPQLLTC